jgi:hypothetical protein
VISLVRDVVEETVAAPVVAAVPPPFHYAAAEDRIHDLLLQPEWGQLHSFTLQVLKDHAEPALT